MTIDGDHVEDIKQFLSIQFKEGNKWVAFVDVGSSPLMKENLRCFKDFSSLEQFNEETSKYEGTYNYFKPIANVLRALEPEKYEAIKPAGIDQLKEEIGKYPIQAFKYGEDY